MTIDRLLAALGIVIVCSHVYQSYFYSSTYAFTVKENMAFCVVNIERNTQAMWCATPPDDSKL